MQMAKSLLIDLIYRVIRTFGMVCQAATAGWRHVVSLQKHHHYPSRCKWRAYHGHPIKHETFSIAQILYMLYL